MGLHRTLSSWQVREQAMAWGPAVILAATTVLVLALFATDRRSGIVAFADVTPVTVAALEGARVETVHVAVGQPVTAGTVVAQLDRAPLMAELEVLVARHAQLVASGDDARLQAQDDAQALSTELSIMRTQAAATAAQLRTGEAERRRLQQQLDAGLVSEDAVASLDMRLAAWRAEAVGLGRTATVLSERRQAASDPAEASEAVGVVLAEIRQLEGRLEAYTLRASVSGRVSAVLHPAGSVIGSAMPLVQLLPDGGKEAVLCLSERQARQTKEGDLARLAPRGGGPVLEARVRAVGPLVDTHAPRCRTLTNFVEWGRAAYVQTSTELVPGQIFDVTLHPADSRPTLSGLGALLWTGS